MANKKVVFVSVPMAGKSDALIERAIQLAKVQYCHINKVNVKEVTFIDGFHDVYQKFTDTEKKIISEKKHESVNWLGMSIAMMGNVDEVVCGINWERARGCRIEVQVAEEYGIPVIKIDKEISEKILEEMREDKRKRSE